MPMSKIDESTRTSLLEELKDDLLITWEDEDTNRRLQNHITKSAAYLEELTGTSLDFSANTRARELLLERCRYQHNSATDEFEVNFDRELSRFILKEAVNAYRKARVIDDETLS